jgi:hypothetical protein
VSVALSQYFILALSGVYCKMLKNGRSRETGNLEYTKDKQLNNIKIKQTNTNKQTQTKTNTNKNKHKTKQTQLPKNSTLHRKLKKYEQHGPH